MKIHKNKPEQNAPSAADLSEKISASENEIKRLKSAVEELVLLNELAVSAGSKTDFEEMLDFIVNKTIKALRAEQGSIILLTRDREKPLRTLIRQDDLSSLKHKYKVGDYITGWVIKNEKALLVENLSTDNRFLSSEEEKREIRTLLCIPIQVKAELIGIFLLINKKGNVSFSQEDFRFLNIIASQSGQIIKNMLLQLETLAEKHKTELAKAAAEKLKQVDLLKSKFLANISHEFRTPLTLILGPLEKLISGNKNSDKSDDYLLMFKNANRLLNLINQLLDLSKIEAGHMRNKINKGKPGRIHKGICFFLLPSC